MTAVGAQALNPKSRIFAWTPVGSEMFDRNRRTLTPGDTEFLVLSTEALLTLRNV